MVQSIDRGRILGLAPRSEFDIRVVRAGRMALGRATGPLDVEHAPAFPVRVDALTEGCQCLVLDLRRVDYVDSEGVRALLQLEQRLEKRGRQLRLVVMPGGRVERTLTLLQLEGHLAIYTGLTEAWIGRGEMPDSAPSGRTAA